MPEETTSQIRRSPEDIWAFVVDHNNDPQSWKKGQVRRAGAGPPVDRDTRARAASPLMIPALEQLEADPAWLLKLREEHDAPVFDVTHRLEADSREPGSPNQRI